MEENKAIRTMGQVKCLHSLVSSDARPSILIGTANAEADMKLLKCYGNVITLHRISQAQAEDQRAKTGAFSKSHSLFNDSRRKISSNKSMWCASSMNS